MINALRLSLLALLLGACGGGKARCSECGEGTLCDTVTGKCVAKGLPAPSQCSPACTGARPVCDDASNPQNPHCVQCLNNAHCPLGSTCSGQVCVGGTSGGAGGSSGGTGGSGGSGTAGGTTGAAGGTTGTAGGTSGTAGGFVSSTDAGVYTGVGSCAPQDAGVRPCAPGCQEGFSCIGGICVLNGGGGPVQVTLRWNTIEDIDLHVLEPLPAGGTCEIYFGDDNQPGNPSSCGAVGTLDLDSEAGCTVDNVDIENVIYPAGTAPPGTYSVYVDHYAHCDPAVTAAPFEVEARYNGTYVGMCGVFRDTDPDWDNANATTGRPVLQFVVP